MKNLTSFQLMRAERCVTRGFNRELAATGLTLSQLYLLWAIRDDEGSNIADIAAKLGCDRSTITRNLKVLGSLVHEEVNKNFKSSKSVSLTPSGRNRLESSIKLIEEHDQQIACSIETFLHLDGMAKDFAASGRKK